MPADPSVHASCVALDGRAALLRGPSGSGKSAMALMLMGLGCGLVADDRTMLSRDGDAVMASCPPSIRGMIEARGIGILRADPVGPARVALVVDLDQTVSDRLPHPRKTALLGVEFPLIGHIHQPHLAAAIVQILKAGWNQV